MRIRNLPMQIDVVREAIPVPPLVLKLVTHELAAEIGSRPVAECPQHHVGAGAIACRDHQVGIEPGSEPRLSIVGVRKLSALDQDGPHAGMTELLEQLPKVLLADRLRGSL